MKFKFIIYLLFLFIYTCDNPISSPNELDCIIDYKGFYDDCGICSGGTSGHTANSDIDCTGYDENGNIILENPMQMIIIWQCLWWEAP